jgi:hypothetical protein
MHGQAIEFRKASLTSAGSNTVIRQIGVVLFGLFMTLLLALGLMGLKAVAAQLAMPWG